MEKPSMGAAGPKQMAAGEQMTKNPDAFYVFSLTAVVEPR